MSIRQRKLITIIISVFAVGVCCYRALPLLLDSASTFSWSTVALISVMVVSVQLINSLKMKVLLKGKESFGSLFAVCLVSNFMGAFLFTQLAGDVSRVWMLNSTKGSSGRHELAVIRDRLSSLAIVCVMVVWIVIIEWGLLPKSLLLLGGLVALLAICSPRLENLLASVTNRLMAISIFKRSTLFRKIQTATELSNLPVRDWVTIHFGSLIVQLFGVAAILFSFLRLEVDLNIYEGAILACVSALVVILPLTAGGVGIREISMYSLLMYWGIEESVVAAGIAQLTMGFLLGTSLGAIGGRLYLQPLVKHSVKLLP